MAEYIEREAFKRKLIDEKNFFPAIVARALDEIPAADVVPKSEVEKLKDEIDRLKYNLKAVIEEIPETKAEVAREIFEEIEKNLKEWSRYVDEVGLICDEIAELKKKYTEKKDCRTCKHFVGCEKAVWVGLCEEYEEKHK